MAAYVATGSVRAAARQTGVPPATVSRWIRGPAAAELRQAADAFAARVDLEVRRAWVEELRQPHRASPLEISRRVELLREEDPVSAIRADELMGRASRQILEGLSRFDRAGGATGGDGEALRLVADGMKSAHEAFLVWSLVPGKVQRELEDLQRRGALAVKLTGAGGGGFLVALWP